MLLSNPKHACFNMNMNKSGAFQEDTSCWSCHLSDGWPCWEPCSPGGSRLQSEQQQDKLIMLLTCLPSGPRLFPCLVLHTNPSVSQREKVCLYVCVCWGRCHLTKWNRFLHCKILVVQCKLWIFPLGDSVLYFSNISQQTPGTLWGTTQLHESWSTFMSLCFTCWHFTN